MTKKLRARQALLEKQGKFATDMNEKHRTFDALDIDRGYDYLPEKPLERVRRAVILSIVAALGPVVTWFAQGARVEGKENLRAVRGGAISVCNHVHTLDTLMVKNALGPFRTFHTGSYYLLKRGALGRIFKAGGFLPVGTRFRDIKNLQDAVGELAARGKIVNFYPEHALWPQYERLRPFQSGAFRYAAKFGVPVLPLFIEFRETKLRRLLHGNAGTDDEQVFFQKFHVLPVNGKDQPARGADFVHGRVPVQFRQHAPDRAQFLSVFRTHGAQLGFEAVGNKGFHIAGEFHVLLASLRSQRQLPVSRRRDEMPEGLWPSSRRDPYRMKFVCWPASCAGIGTPAARPASRHLSIHAMLRPSWRMVQRPSASCSVSSATLPCTLFQ